MAGQQAGSPGGALQPACIQFESLAGGDRGPESQSSAAAVGRPGADAEVGDGVDAPRRDQHIGPKGRGAGLQADVIAPQATTGHPQLAASTDLQSAAGVDAAPQIGITLLAIAGAETDPVAGQAAEGHRIGAAQVTAEAHREPGGHRLGHIHGLVYLAGHQPLAAAESGHVDLVHHRLLLGDGLGGAGHTEPQVLASIAEGQRVGGPVVAIVGEELGDIAGRTRQGRDLQNRVGPGAHVIKGGVGVKLQRILLIPSSAATIIGLTGGPWEIGNHRFPDTWQLIAAGQIIPTAINCEELGILLCKGEPKVVIRLIRPPVCVPQSGSIHHPAEGLP